MKRVLVHVGTPKTGTSYVQDVMFRQQELLAGHGIHYVADRFDAHFLAALDLMQRKWGGLENDAVGAWDRLAAAVRAVEDGTVIISHEIFAYATAEQAARALGDLGLHDGTEIHLVLSARDLGRQIPAEWQESVKHRARSTYHRFLEEIRAPERTSRADWFWGVQELPAILLRWGAAIPAERVHLVTVPPRGSAEDLLWQRFAGVFGLDLVPDLDTTADRANPSLGAAEAAFMRRLNERLHGDCAPADYRTYVRERLSHQALSGRSDSARIALPPELHGWASELAEDWIAELAGRGYDVVGDLADLRPSFDDTPFVDPDAVPGDRVLAVALDAVAELVHDLAARPEPAPLPPSSAADQLPGARVGRLAVRALRGIARRVRRG